MIVSKYLYCLLLFVSIFIAGCANSEPEVVPTQIALPTAEPTLAPTDTLEPTDIPLPTPTELFIPQTVADNPDEQAYMRVINATSELGIVDVYVEALAIATNLSYGVYSDREDIASGRYKVRVLPSGAFLTEEPLYEETLNIFGGESLIFVITGTPENVTLTRLNESNDPLPSDTSRLMMVNALNGASNLMMLVNDVPQTAITPYLRISEITTNPSRRVTLKFQNFSEVVLEQLFDLRERHNYTFAVVGDVNQPDDIQLLVLQSSAPGTTQISIINASPSIGLVDIYFGNERFIYGSSYGENSVPATVLSGVYEVSVYAEGANPDEVEPITGTQFIANPDELIALILIGEPNSLRFAIYRSDPQPTYDNQARITFLNSLESVPSIFLQSTDDRLEQRLTFGRVSNTFVLSVDKSISFTWIQQLRDSQDIALENFSDFTPLPGLNYLYIFAGRGYDTPVLLSYEVGTLGFETVDIGDELEPTPPSVISDPTRVRLLNLWEGRQLNVRVDGTMVAEGLEYGMVTNPLVIDSGERLILFSDANGDRELVEINDIFEEARNYVVIAYNNRFDPDIAGAVIQLDDTGGFISSSTSGIRLVVLEALLDSQFGIGYSQATDQIVQPNNEDDFRRSLTSGIDQIIRSIPEGNSSDIELIPTGTFNIRIIDNREAALAYTHTNFTLEAGTVYNVFLWENPDTRETTTIIVPYSSQ